MLSSFHKQGDSHRSVCKDCRSIKDREYRANNVPRTLLSSARYRAKQKGIEFSITLGDIKIPTHCPVFGYRLMRTLGNSRRSPSLDRIDSRKGYTNGNVRVISSRANQLKSDSTPYRSNPARSERKSFTYYP